MSGKPILYYFDGRGKMESIRWLLAASGVEFEEVFLTTREQYEALLKDKDLLFGQVPMVEMDGMKLVQSRAIMQYIATKYDLYGKDVKERLLIDMYVGGSIDLMEIMMRHPYLSAEDKQTHITIIVQKAKERYFPVYEKVLKDHGGKFLVGNQLSWADLQLLESILMVEEKHSNILADFPQLKEFKKRLSEIPTIKAFLQPGSKRKQESDDKFVETVRKVFQAYFNVKLN